MMKKSGNKKYRLILCTVFFTLLYFGFGNVSVQAATKCKVTFSNNSGSSTSAAYTRLNTVVEKGTVITLPSFAEKKGYVNLGWTTAKGKTAPLYKIGNRYTVYKDTKFFLVQSPVYRVSFAMSDGKSNRFFQSLQKTVQSGKTLILPEAEKKEDYTFMGWAKQKNSAAVDYKAGIAYKPEANITLYAVYSKSVTVTYLSNDGNVVYRTVTLGKGSSMKLSGMANDAGYTFLGWSTRPGASDNPPYLVGKSIIVNGNLKLYAVQFKKSTEYEYKAGNLPRVNTRKYTKVIFVGDSRTYRMKQTMEAQFHSTLLQGIDFVAKGGASLNWFNETGYRKLLKVIGKGGTAEKPIAIVFNLGVNDLQKVTEYIARMKEIEPVLKKKNCRIFYMSINPLNNVILRKNNSKDRPETRVYYFNKKIQSELCSLKSFTYIDMFTYLTKKGYSFDDGRGTDTGIEDGIHYSTRTYKRIYSYVINTLNKI